MPHVRHETAGGGAVVGEISDLTDVDTTGTSPGDLLTNVAGVWTDTPRVGINVGDFNDDGTYSAPGDNVSGFTNDAGYLTDITAENIGDLADVTITADAAKHILTRNAGDTAYVNVARSDILLSELGTKVIDNLDDVTITAAAVGDVLVRNAGNTAFVNTQPYNTRRRVSNFVQIFTVQAGPVGEWIPMQFPTQLLNGHGTGWTAAKTGSTTIIGTWTPVALPQTFIDVVDASGLEGGGVIAAKANMYISIVIPGGASTVCRYTSITVGGGAGGSDRINMPSAAGTLGNGHRGVGTPAAGAAVAQCPVELFSPSSTVAQVILGLGSVEAIASGSVGWRWRSAQAAAAYTPAEGVVNLAANTAEETAQVAKLGPLGANGSGLFFEFKSTTAGGTAGQTRTDPIGFLAPNISYADFGVQVTS